jgi:hypothetical protein
MPSSVSSPIDPVVAHLVADADGYGISGGGLLRALSQVPDPWARRGVRHSISAFRTLPSLEGERLDVVLGGWAASQASRASRCGVRQAVAADGKIVRGSRGGQDRPGI